MSKTLRVKSDVGLVPSDARLLEIIKTVCDGFEGDFTHLEGALGALIVGRVVGWKGLRLMHTRGMFKRYEGVLKLRFRDVLPDVTAESDRLYGVRAMEKIGSFWHALSSGLIRSSDAALGRAKS